MIDAYEAVLEGKVVDVAVASVIGLGKVDVENPIVDSGSTMLFSSFMFGTRHLRFPSESESQ